MDVFRPTSAWGPGDRSQKKLWLEQKMRKRKILLNFKGSYKPAALFREGFKNVWNFLSKNKHFGKKINFSH